MSKNKKNKIEIKTAKGKWKVVELIKFIGYGILLIRLPDGQIIKRKAENFRYISRRIQSTTSDITITSKFKGKRKSKNKTRRKSKFPKSSYILNEYKKDMGKWKKKNYGGK